MNNYKDFLDKSVTYTVIGKCNGVFKKLELSEEEFKIFEKLNNNKKIEIVNKNGIIVNNINFRKGE